MYDYDEAHRIASDGIREIARRCSQIGVEVNMTQSGSEGYVARVRIDDMPLTYVAADVNPMDFEEDEFEVVFWWYSDMHRDYANSDFAAYIGDAIVKFVNEGRVPNGEDGRKLISLIPSMGR